ncbi:MAG: haloacid dehalogenase-like hydrolase [bacterium]|nr:haloacid dehalogenase-like hydrolase [bacterium]
MNFFSKRHFFLALFVAVGANPVMAKSLPLPAWNNGATKQKIIDFVDRVTDPNSNDFVPKAERMATFDNDGTLWSEYPVVQFVFMGERLKQLLPSHPEWKDDQAVQAAINGEIEYFIKNGHQVFRKLFEITHSGMSRTEFNKMAEEFFETAKHPKYNVHFTKTKYQPMIELLSYLRDNGFQTWLCSGGGTDFMRAMSYKTYGIPPEQVIGSIGGFEFISKNGQEELVKTSTVLLNNDKQGKPVGITIQTGRTPIFSVGNVRNGGDIAHLTFTNGNQKPHLELLINHDDSNREFAYAEDDNASLKAAKKQGWTVVSMKDDWNQIFSFE